MGVFDRRKGYREHTLDRRRTYVDIMERVLGSEMLSRPPTQERFSKDINIIGASLGTAVTSVEVRVLDNIRGEKS